MENNTKLRLLGYYSFPNQKMAPETELIQEANTLAPLLDNSIQSLYNNPNTDEELKNLITVPTVFIFRDEKRKLIAFFTKNKTVRLTDVQFSKGHITQVPLKYKAWFNPGEPIKLIMSASDSSISNIEGHKNSNHKDYHKSYIRANSFSHNNLTLDNKVVEKIKTRLRLNNNYFIGQFSPTQTEGWYKITDIRNTDFTKIEDKERGIKNITISFRSHNEIYNKYAYYKFTWTLLESDPLKFGIDLREDITPIYPKDIVGCIHDSIINYPASAAKKITRTLDTLNKQLTQSGKEVFIYELLQNANDYPRKKRVDNSTLPVPVDVEFHITKDFLTFQHTGDYFNAKNIAAICDINDGEKSDNVEAIGYKGIGFKTVFLDNDYVYLNSGNYSLRFDKSATDIINTPWQILPIWTDYKNVPYTVKKIFSHHSNDIFRVKFALQPRDKSILTNQERKDNYINLFCSVFETERVILFIPNIRKVSVFIGDSIKPSIVREKSSNKWCVSKPLTEDVPEEIRNKINYVLENGNGSDSSGYDRVPEKYLNFNKTAIKFACKKDGRKLLPVEDAILYCYLPAKKANWGFSFLMNTDMVPNGARDDIEDIELNHEITKIAGRQFFHWIKGLIESKEYDLNSIFSLIPNFEECKKINQYKVFIEEFQNEFESLFLSEPIIPTVNGELICFESLIVDEILIMKDNIVFTDEEFYKLFDNKKGKLPINELRNKYFYNLIHRYKDKIHSTIEKDDLVKLTDNPEFLNWITNNDNNKKFLRFLITKGDITDFKDKNIFMQEGGTVTSASSLYYNVDAVVKAVPFLNNYLHRLSSDTRKFVETFTANWGQEEKSIFKQFDVNSFVSSLILNKDASQDVKKRLEIEAYSLKFYDFLATNNVTFVESFKGLPFFDANNNVVEDFIHSGIIFFESEDGEKTKKASWMNSEWIHFVSPKYSDAAMVYMKNYLGVRDYNSKIIANEIILGEKYNKVISAKIQENFEINKAFVSYCYNHHSDYIDGSLNNYPLYAENFKTEYAYQILDGVSPKVEADINASHPATWSNHYVLTEDHVYFINALFENMFGKEWLDKEWMFCLSEKYYEGLNANEQTTFKVFLNKKFGVKEFTNNIFVDEIVLPNIKTILENISKNEEGNYDFVRFLDDNFRHIFEDNRNNITKFSVFPVVDNNGDIVKVKPSVQKIDVSNDGVNTFYRTYLYDSKLENILSLSWMQNSPVFMANKTYGNSSALKVIGLKAFDFADFFNGVIGSTNITYIISTLKDFETNKEFHDFLKKNVSDLKQFAIIRANVPVYLLGHTKPATTCTGHKILSPAAKDLFALGLVEPKDLDIIDPRYNPEQDFNYWTNEDRLNNKQFTTNHFVSWLKSNENTFAQKLQTKEANIKFWRWAKRNLKDSVKSFQTLPVMTKQGTILSLDNTIYLSDIYMGDTGYENLVLSFDGKANIISGEYVQHGDDIKEWLDFWTKLNVRSNEVDILRDTVLPKISEFKVDGLLKRFALHRNELEKDVPNFFSKLSNINLKSDAGLFLPAKDVIYIDCEKTEPFKMVKLENTVSFTTADEKVLMGQIIDLHVGRRVTSLTEWRTLKINTYIKKQNTDIDSVKNYHYAFINELCSLYDKDYSYINSIDKEIKQIKLQVKDSCFLLGKEITMGTAYKPFCDFEANNIPYRYLSERYLSESNNKPQVTLRVMFGLHSNLEDSDLHLMEESRSFALYIWQDYLTGNTSYSANNISKLKGLIEQHKLDNLECIPTKSGLKSPEKLYSRRIYAYVSKLKNYEELTPYKEIQNIQYSKDQKDKYLFDLLPFKMQLNFNDCVYDLFYFKKPDDRKLLLAWMLNQYVAEKDATIIDSYREDQNALWQNAKLKPVPISKLYALNPSSTKLSQFFGTNEHIINSAYFPVEEDKFNQTCQMLGVIVINESDVKINPQIIPNGNYTEWNLFFEEVSLLMAGIESELNWKEKFNTYKHKVIKTKLIQCSSISMSYSKDKDVSQNKKKFYHPDSDSEKFYYVDDFRNAKVFIDFVESFKEYMGTDLDKDLLSDILFAKKSDLRDMFYEQTKLLDNEDFRNTLSNYFPEFLKQEDVNDDRVDEPEGPSTFDTFGLPNEPDEDSEDNVTDDGTTKQYGNQKPLNTSSSSTDQNSKDKLSTVDTSSAHDSHSDQENEKVSVSGNEGGYMKTSSSNTQIGEKNSADAPNSGRKSNRRSNGKTHYEPQPYTAAQVSAWKSKGQPLELSKKEATEDERGDINSLLGENMTAEQVADANYLAQLRLYNSLKDRGDISEEKDDKASFIKDGSTEEEIHLSSGKWIHKCSAAHGILYISPKVWNMVSNDKYIVCVYLGAKQNEFMYLNSKDDILKLISNDDIIIKMTGKERVKAVDELYDHVLNDVTGTAYTMIRVVSNEEYNSFFEPITNSGTDNEDDL